MLATKKAIFFYRVFSKRFAQNYCFQNFSWLLLPYSPHYSWTYKFLVKAFPENFNLTACYVMLTYHIIVNFSILFILQNFNVVTEWNFKFQISSFLCFKFFDLFFGYMCMEDIKGKNYLLWKYYDYNLYYMFSNYPPSSC